jgi:hypothetical protein
MRVEGGDDNNVGGTATPVGTVPCPGRPDHEWTAARVGTDVQWWQCTRCAVLATTAELDEAEQGGVIRFAPGEVTLDLATGEFERRQS